MSKLSAFSGSDEFCPGGSIYPNPKESSIFLSLGWQVDVYFPLHKRSRTSAPFGFFGERFERKKPSIEILTDECLVEILRGLPGGQERSSYSCVSKC